MRAEECASVCVRVNKRTYVRACLRCVRATCVLLLLWVLGQANRELDNEPSPA